MYQIACRKIIEQYSIFMLSGLNMWITCRISFVINFLLEKKSATNPFWFVWLRLLLFWKKSFNSMYIDDYCCVSIYIQIQFLHNHITSTSKCIVAILLCINWKYWQWLIKTKVIADGSRYLFYLASKIFFSITLWSQLDHLI